MNLLDYWQQALDEEFGLRIETEDPRRLTSALYEARKDYPQFHDIRICHVGDELWLVKQTVGVLDAGR